MEKKEEKEKIKYLTIHGHFYQPPRENPWLETIEVQDSAKPFHDWNERVNFECYAPNSVSRIVDSHNKILDIVNNYELISFNFGPTLLSWMETHDEKTYERIIEADNKSMQERGGHGNALAQVYNHIIMPLANENDKYTQVLWGIKDFIYRFGRKPEGMWLAETAIDYDTIDVLIECGIKFTVLSPYQSERVRSLVNEDAKWEDASTGNIDPARAYRCYSKTDKEKYLDIFFYDGAISKSVAFDNLLQNGERFISRLKDGVSETRDYNQLVNIATDGESYGHHTKFGDMALSYVLKNRAEKEGFVLTNYAQYLELEPPTYEVELKPVSSWSCFHGVGRWSYDCGCQTGGQPHWNQKWRKPLREALDYLRDELITVFEAEGTKYFSDVWKTRNDYIEVILDRNEDNINKFLEKYQTHPLTNDEKISAIKLLEMQRQAMLMYTSCGWFFCEISGIETVQILKYAGRAIQLAQEFSSKDIETHFLEILSEAKSNLVEYGSGKDLYLRFVKPCIIDVKQLISHWVITSLYKSYEEETDLYSWKIKQKDYRILRKGRAEFVFGRVEAVSKITLEAYNMMFALLSFGDEDFQCAIKDFTDITSYNKIKSDLMETFDKKNFPDVIRLIDEHFGKEYYNIDTLFLQEKKTILGKVLEDRLDKFSSTFQSLYSEGRMSILRFNDMGLEVPQEFKIVAEYMLSKQFNSLIETEPKLLTDGLLQRALYFIQEAKNLGAKLYKLPSQKIFEEKILRNINKLADNFELHQAHKLFNLLSMSKQLEINPNIREAQNVYHKRILSILPELLRNLKNSENIKTDKQFANYLINIGELLDFDVKELYIILSNIKV